MFLGQKFLICECFFNSGKVLWVLLRRGKNATGSKRSRLPCSGVFLISADRKAVGGRMNFPYTLLGYPLNQAAGSLLLMRLSSKPTPNNCHQITRNLLKRRTNLEGVLPLVLTIVTLVSLSCLLSADALHRGISKKPWQESTIPLKISGIRVLYLSFIYSGTG